MENHFKLNDGKSEGKSKKEEKKVFLEENLIIKCFN